VGTYTITVTNSNAHADTSGLITVTDTLPLGLTATGIDGTGWGCDLGTLTCTRSEVLPAGSSFPETITVTVKVAADAAASVTNTVTVSGGGQVNLSNDSDPDSTIIDPTTDLEITNVTLDPPLPAPDQDFVATVTVQNWGRKDSDSIVPVYAFIDPDTDPAHGLWPLPSGWIEDQYSSVSHSDSVTDTGINAESSVTKTINIGGLSAGVHKIYFYADPNFINDESNEENNVFGPISINIKSSFEVLGIWTTALNYDEGWRVNMHPRMLGDVNGDDKDDLVGFGYAGVFVGLANSAGTGFDTPTMWTTALNYDEGWRVDMHPRMLGDVNGDGKDDLVGFGYAGVFVGLANSAGTGFNAPSMWTNAFNYNEGWRVDMHPRMLGDVNGDGKDDLVGIGYAGTFVALANSAGTGFNAPSMWTSAFSYEIGWRVDKHPRMLGDANRDGRDDLIGFGDDGVYVALANSTGSGFDAPSMWTSAFNYSEGWRVDMHPRTVGDVNGDGRIDLIGIGYAGTFVALANSTGDGFVVDGMWTVALNYNEGWRVDMHPRMIGDVTGDGAADLVGIGYAGVFVIRAK